MNPENYIQPVDPDIFFRCNQMYCAGYSMEMPKESSSNEPVMQHRHSLLSRSDNPIGMLAIIKELKQLNLSESQVKSLLARITEFGSLLKRKELSPFIKQGSNDQEIMVSKALVRACATARVYLDGDRIRFDLEDLARITKEISGNER